MKRTLLAMLFLMPLAAFAQQPVVTQPTPVDNTAKTSTIATLNVFQSVWPASTNNRGRSGCNITNYGASTMYVYVGPITEATTPKSRRLAANATFSCGANGIVMTGDVNITGAAGETYQADQQ